MSVDLTEEQLRALALEQARGTATLRVELATAASKALTKIVDDMAPWELGFAESNAVALAAGALLETLRAQVPRQEKE